MILLLALLSCGSGLDADLQPHRDAVAAWKRGKMAIEQQDFGAARVAFAQARTARPKDLLLEAWEAQAAAGQGQLDEAIEMLDDVLRSQPGFAEARYNRAAYLARRGRFEDQARAAGDLQAALEDGGWMSRDVLRDPDFDAWRAEPAFSFLPPSLLSVAVDAPQQVVFLGSVVQIRFRVTGAEGPLSVRAEQAQGPAEVIKVVETPLQSTDGPVRDLVYSLRVQGAGTVSMGPFHVRAGEHELVVASLSFEAKAPPGRETPSAPLHPMRFTTPGELAGTVPSLRRLGPDLLVQAGATDQVLTEPPALPHRLYELREGPDLVWTIRAYTLPAPSAVTVRHDGKVVLQSQL